MYVRGGRGLIDSTLVGHVAYAVGQQLLPGLSSHSRAHGQYRACHYAKEAAADPYDRAEDRRSQADSVVRQIAGTCETIKNDHE